MNQWKNFVNIIESDKEKRKQLVTILDKNRYPEMIDKSEFFAKKLPKSVNTFITQVRERTISEDKLEIIATFLGFDLQELTDDYNEIKEIVKKEKDLKNQISDLKNQISLIYSFKSHIYVETSLKKRVQPTSSISISGREMKYIYNLPNKITELSKEDQIILIKDIILQHYKKREGKSPFWGDIIGYVYYPYFNNPTNFSVDGDVLNL